MSLDELVVRPATAHDLAGVARVRTRSWQAGYAGILPAEYLAGLSIEADLARRREVFAEHGAVVDTLVAVRDGTVDGFASFGPYRPDPGDQAPLGGIEGELYALYVEPERWGAGIGRRLLERAVARLDERGLAPVRLWVLAENARGRRFYEAAGFAADGQTAFFSRGGRDAPELRYTLAGGR